MPLKSSEFIDLTMDEVDGPVPSMDISAGMDEIIIDANKKDLVEQNKFIIRERFAVNVSIGLLTHDGKLWLDFHGEAKQRKKAKNYVKTLCNPTETVTLQIPPDLKGLLSNPAIRQRLEETTQAVVMVTSNNEVIIQGLDTLSVTLAMSSVEDIIDKHVNSTQKSLLKSPDCSSRLNRELRRLSSEDRSSILTEDCSHYNDAVKRTIISWMRDEGDTEGVKPGVSMEVDLRATEGKKTTAASGETKAMKFTVDEFNFKLPPPPAGDKIHNDPAMRPKMLEQQIGLTHHLDDYMERRCKDHEEEESINDRQALIRKNEGRQELLREAYKKREEEKNGGGVSKTEAAKPQLHADHMSLADSLTEIDLTEENLVTDSGTVIMDTLDDFSLPVISRNKQKRIHASPQNREAKKTHRTQRKKTPSPPRQKSLRDRPLAAAVGAHKRTPSPPQAAAPLCFVPRNTVPRIVQSQPMGPLRYIVIDGSNIALAHGNHRVFSCKGIQICVDFFRRRGHTEVTAFVPQWRTRAPSREKPISHQHLLEELREQGSLVFTPARRVPNKNIVCYDDKFIVRLAHETDGIMVSNDNYRDLWMEKPEWRDTITNRLVGYSFVGDIFMLPDDPLGRTGPSLDDFLRKPAPNRIRNHSQPLPQASVSAHGAPMHYSAAATLQMPAAVSQPRAMSGPIVSQAKRPDKRADIRDELNAIFVGNEAIVQKVLDSNRDKDNLHQLSELVLLAMDHVQ